MSQKDSKITIGFDIDDVLARFVDEFVERMNRHSFDNNLNYYIEHPVTDYFFMKDHHELFEKEILNGLFLDLNPYERNVVYANSLIDSGLYDIHFITARSAEENRFWSPELISKIQADTKTWLRHYFPTFDFDKLHFCGRKDSIIREHGIKLMVDDRLDACERFSTVCKSVVIDRPWNRYKEPKDVTRIESLCDLELLLKHL